MTDADINQIYEQCIDFLKENVSYCFQSRRANPTNWVLGTWSMKTRRSTILKKGTEADKSKVATATNRNRARRPNTRPGRQMATNPLYRYRQRQRVDRLIRNTPQQTQDDEDEEPQQETKTQDDEDEEEVDLFRDAFHHGAELSAAARAREQQAREEIDAELRAEIAEQEANRIRVGDAVGENGDPLFVRGTHGEAPIPGTEAHRVWLRGHVDSLPR
jgi:hypothetical protein